MNNQMLLNPALAGTSDGPDIRAGYRLQWAGFKDAPRSFYLSGQTTLGAMPQHMRGKVRFQKDYFHGLGFVVGNTVTGPTSRTSAYLAYAYNQGLTKTIRASFGLFGGMQQFTLNDSKLIFADPKGSTITGFTRVFPDAGVGLWVYSKRFWAGGSILQIFRNQISTYDATQGIYIANRHLFFSSGFLIPLAHGWTLVPSILVKKVAPAPWTVDINCKLKFAHSFYTGLSYRSQDAVVVLAGFSPTKQLDLGYSYDAIISTIGRFSSGSHEIFLGYRINPPRKNYSPSDFWK